MAGPAPEGQILGHSNDVLRTETLAELVAVTDHLSAQASRSIDIVTADAEPELYGRAEYGRTINNFIARRRRIARIRLLLVDPQAAPGSQWRRLGI